MKLILKLSIFMLLISTVPVKADMSWIESREYKGNLCYDGDTCYITATVLPDSLKKMSIRILGIDTS